MNTKISINFDSLHTEMTNRDFQFLNELFMELLQVSRSKYDFNQSRIEFFDPYLEESKNCIIHFVPSISSLNCLTLDFEISFDEYYLEINEIENSQRRIIHRETNDFLENYLDYLLTFFKSKYKKYYIGLNDFEIKRIYTVIDNPTQPDLDSIHEPSLLAPDWLWQKKRKIVKIENFDSIL